MTEKKNRVRAAYWVDVETKGALEQLAKQGNLSVGRTLDWLMKRNQKTDFDNETRALKDEVKSLRAAVNAMEVQTEALIQLFNTVFNIEQWNEADLFDTNTNPANAIVKSLEYAQSKREASIKSVRYRNQK